MTSGGDWIGSGAAWDLGDSGPTPPPPHAGASRRRAEVVCCPACKSIAVRIRSSQGSLHRLECTACGVTWKESAAGTPARAIVFD